MRPARRSLAMIHPESQSLSYFSDEKVNKTLLVSGPAVRSLKVVIPS